MTLADLVTPDVLVLGHLTRDLLASGGVADGGTALYASVAAQRLGRRVAVFSAAPARPASLPAEIALALQPCEAASTFENRYGSGGRVQWLHAAAPPLDVAQLPDSWRATRLVHLGPVLQEVPLAAALDAFPQALIVATPQGWMRSWPDELPGRISRAPWMPAPALLRRIDLLVMSIEDLQGDEEAGREYARHCGCVVVTRGEQGATLYLDGRPQHVPTTPVYAPEPTGLGDVFAAAMLLAFDETHDHLCAARYATAVAARTAAGRGLGSIPYCGDLPPVSDI
jgi:sugar/nucleoside kinase (ribokinase family)